jgi:hypothetical protein
MTSDTLGKNGDGSATMDRRPSVNEPAGSKREESTAGKAKTGGPAAVPPGTPEAGTTIAPGSTGNPEATRRGDLADGSEGSATGSRTPT